MATVKLPRTEALRSVIMNYRQMFLAKYGYACRLADASILEIFDTVFDDSSNALQDLARVEEMYAADVDLYGEYKHKS